jgi:uncharacterized LabA/DUF88 family protein
VFAGSSVIGSTHSVSILIIISGDGDFHCLIEYLEGKSKLLKIIIPNKRHSTLLKKFAPFISNIQLFKEKVEKSKERHSRGI